MKPLNSSSLVSAAVVVGLALLGAVQPSAAQQPTVELTPSVIQMGAFYAGAQLQITGMVSTGSQVVVVIRGPQVAQNFNRKRRMGPIWVNSGQVHVSGVPALLLCLSPAPVASLLSRPAIEKYQLDVDALRSQMQVTPPEEATDVIRTNYLSLKADEGKYRFVADAVIMGQATEAGTPYTVEVEWSKIAPPAAYEVKVYECRNQEVVAEASTGLLVDEVGIPAAMALAARDNAYLYGVVAVAVALVLGFGIDFLVSRMRRRRGSGHGPVMAGH